MDLIQLRTGGYPAFDDGYGYGCDYYLNGYHSGFVNGTQYTWQQLQQLMYLHAMSQVPRGRRYYNRWAAGFGGGGGGGGNPWMGVGGGIGGGMGMMMGSPYGFMAPGMW
ncbi:hypothetical protein AC578_9647 [Pseudocercospora eumusae]|uniref:Uncharacterized protein n=1 Tax=Pseudocercospora eumusae TaxID=321146 RepID=A0A139H1E6_9PEZI|nr:hypothetical protein AC578_9647 [Pseudocercospora eumusae]